MVVDTTPPGNAITYPYDSNISWALSMISGTANAYFSGMDSMEVQISSYSSGTWYPEPAYNWNTADVYDDTSSTGNVTVTWKLSNLPAWESGVYYRVVKGY